MSENNNASFGEKLFDFSLKNIPIPIFIYGLLMYGMYKLLEMLLNTTNIDAKVLNFITCVIIFIMFLLTCTLIIGLAFGLLKNKKEVYFFKNLYWKESDKQVKTHIIEASDDQSRNEIYLNVNQEVKKSYKVYGTSLHSIASNHEEMLLKMADNNINIQLCMMNPAITEDELCKNIIESNSCVIYKLLKEKLNSEEEVNKTIITEIDNYIPSMNEYDIYISSSYIKSYFNTAIDYKKRLKVSYEDLKAIVDKINNRENGNKNAKIKIMDSFIPISITIADAEEDTGKMVVEFYIPYTSNRVLIELNKNKNKSLFEGFLEFYNSLWDQAYEQ